MDGKCQKCGGELLEDNTCPECDADYDALDQEDVELLNQLKERIKGLEQEMNENLGNGLDDMYKRVDGVIRSVKRIESMDQPDEEALLYREAGSPAPPDKVGGELAREAPDHVQIRTETPYEAAQTSAGDLDLTSYGLGLDGILENLIKLIRIKRERGNVSEAWNLVSVALEISPESPDLQNEIATLEEISREMKRVQTKSAFPKPQEGRTTVLVPELEEEIVRLEKRAAKAIEQLEKLMGSGSLPRGKAERFMNYLQEAKALFAQKMFTKGEDIALSSINELKAIMKENMDNKIQDNLDRAREMVESIEKGEGNLDQEFVESVRERFDIALRSYLIDEFERANLLAMEVIRKVMEMTHPESASIRKEILDLRRTLRGMRDQPQLMNRILDIEDLLKRSEDLLNRRELDDSSRILASAKDMFQELEVVERLQSQAIEMQIKLSNRMERLGSSKELSDAIKKMEYMSNLMDKERFEDVIIIGKDIESELDSIEAFRKDRECKEVTAKIDEMMAHVEEMDDPKRLKKDLEEVRNLYIEGNLAATKQKGQNLLERMSGNLKMLSITRAKRICNSIVESRTLVTEMRSLSLDTAEFERKVRKARTLIKDQNYMDGLRQMDSVNDEMRAYLLKRRGSLKGAADIHRDSMEVIMERYKDEPAIILMRRKQIPMLKRYISLGNYRRAVEMYERLAERLDSIMVKEETRKRVESDLAQGRFEIYKRKDEGFDISEPLSIFGQAQKRFQDGKVIPAEYLLEVSRKYFEQPQVLS